MIDLKLYEKDEAFREQYLMSLKNRGQDAAPLKEALELNSKRKKLIQESDLLISKRKKIEENLRKKDSEDKKTLVHEAQLIGDEIQSLGKKLKRSEDQIQDILFRLPNRCHEKAPAGSSPSENVLVRKSPPPKKISFSPRSHEELLEGKIDLKRAAKTTGARFSFLRGAAAGLERALAGFMLDTHIKQNGYEELSPPLIINEKALLSTGQLPRFKEDLFRIEGFPYYLLPTAEVSSTHFFSGEILKEEDLPYRFVSYTPCFRSEAGSYGKDTKGLIRQHQFMKVELMVFSHPEKSDEELEKLTSHAEGILKDLELPYRVMNLCTGDLGFSSARCYDLEVWMPAQKTYREISSCSNCEDYQARRGNIRFHSSAQAKGRPRFLHTLNGSGLAVGRTLCALLENHQDEKGRIYIPEKLRPYMDGKKVIE